MDMLTVFSIGTVLTWSKVNRTGVIQDMYGFRYWFTDKQVNMYDIALLKAGKQVLFNSFEPNLVDALELAVASFQRHRQTNGDPE